MGGFDTIKDNDPNTDETVMYADNACWDGSERNTLITTDGQLWIGSTVAPHVRVGNLVAGTGITITPGSGTIQIASTITGAPVTTLVVQNSTPPGDTNVVPNVGGQIAINGAAVAAHSIPIETHSRALNEFNIELQYSSAAAVSTAASSGIAHFESAQFTVDANGFVSMVGGVNLPAIQTLTGDDGTAVGPDANGDIDLNGFIVANATNAKPLFFDNEAPNVLRAELQVAVARAGAPANTNDAGICSFDNVDFTVDANGFVALAGAGAGQTITGDSGGALLPNGGNWNILGRSGSITAGAASTLTVRSPDYGDVGGSGTSTLNTGEFVTATVARVLPLTAGLEDGDLVEFVATTANVLTVTANAGQRIRLGNVQTAVAGTAVSSAIGDSISLRFRAADQIWYATSSVGIWGLT